MGSHIKFYKTLLVIRLWFFWPCMKRDIIDWIRDALAVSLQKCKSENLQASYNFIR